MNVKKFDNEIGSIVRYIPPTSNITNKEKGLLKGALRRVFSRSELRQRILAKSRIEHSDITRPRVKNWSWCQECGHIVPTHTIDIDHINPVVPVNKKALDMTPNELVAAIWCDENNLQHLCSPCHDEKSSVERKQRNAYKKGLK